MDETPHRLDAGPEQPEPLQGVPVGPGGRDGAARRSGPAAPSWVVPMIVLALVAGLGIGLAIGLLVGGDGGESAADSTTTAVASTTLPWGPEDAYAAVTVTGDPLPALGSAATDTAVGLPVPDIAGTDYTGNALSITDNGKAKLIVALAHWCPYCNAELPILQEWYAAGIPDDIEVISLSVYADPAKANFPPAAWLRAANWSLPLIADDEARTLVGTLGIPAVPFWLLVSADGNVMERGTGQVEAETLDSIVALLQGGDGATTTTP